MNQKSKDKLRLAHLGKFHSKETKEKISKTLTGKKYAPGRIHPGLGKKQSPEWIAKRIMLGNKNPAWKGGVTSENMKIRKSKEMNEWRLQVFGRDNFTCQNCGIRGTYLEAHHIKSFAKFPELRFDINNGITYCKSCHISLDENTGKHGKKNKIFG